MSTTQTHSQIEDLQSRVTFQEDTLQALDHRLAEQDLELQTLRAQMQILNKKLTELMSQLESQGGPPASERPPHY